MQTTHLVIIGVKSNSWAWSLEQIRSLVQENQKVVALDFGHSKQGQRKNARDLFQDALLSELKVPTIDWREVLTRPEEKMLVNQVRLWLNNLASEKIWVDSRFGNLPLGRILMSNYARTAGTPLFELKLMSNSLQFKIATQAVIADAVYSVLKIDHSDISISNGRSPIEAAIFSQSREKGIKTHILERGATTKKWYVYDISCHYPPDWWKMLEKVQSETNFEDIENSAKKYWEGRLSGWDELSGINWRKHFDEGKLPEGLPKKFVTFFCTSEHETPAIAEFECTDLGFPSQRASVEALVEVCAKLGIQLVIKRHPNSVAVDGVDREEVTWKWVQSHANVFLIGPKNRVDTYALLRRTSAVVTFKSSVGIEATALGIPARALGPAEWAFMPETRAWNVESLEDFLRDPQVIEGNPENTWGFLVSNFGKNLSIFEDITGGYAQANGVRYFATDYYQSPMKRFAERASRKLWSLRLSLRNKFQHERSDSN
jgi:hypothetical protein